MNIILVIDTLGVGGAQTQMVYLAERLKDEGHEVTIYLYSPLAILEESFNHRLKGIEIVFNSSGELAAVLSLYRLVKRKKALRVISYQKKANRLSLIALLFLKGVDFYPSERTGVDTMPRIGDYVWMFCLILRAKRLLCNSRAKVKQLKQRYWYISRKIGYIPNIVFLPDSRVSQYSKDRSRSCKDLKILVLARISKTKNPELLMQVLSRLSGEISVEVDWIGRWDSDVSKSYLENKLEILLQSNSRVKWRWDGQVNPRSVNFEAYDCMVVTSKSEGSSNAILEAMANYLPVVIPDIADHEKMSRFRGGSAFLYKPLDADGLLTCLLQIVNINVESLASIKENARLLVQTKHNTHAVPRFLLADKSTKEAF